MIDQLLPIAEAARIRPLDNPMPVNLIGAGAIVEFAHIPAYRQAGIPLNGIYDIDRARARHVADQVGIPKVFDSLDDLFADEAPVIDIAVVPQAQPELVGRGIVAGRHMLCQKPFALDLDLAHRLAKSAARHDIKIAVQQQLQYDEGVAAAREMVRRGWIGDPTAITFHVDVNTDWSAWKWLVESEKLEIQFHSIHYIDAIRSIFGTPDRVFSAAARTPGQVPVGETRTMSTLLYPSGLRALVHVNHENHNGDPVAEFRIDGSAGSIRGTLGLLYDYPHGRPDTLEIRSETLPTDGWLPYPVTTRWLPDAFAGPMVSLQQWIDGGPEAPTSVASNLGTLATVQALYRSHESGEAQTVEKG